MCIMGINISQQEAHCVRDTRTKVFSGQTMEVSHGLIDWLDAVSHGELIDNFLWRFVEVNLPGVVAFGLRKLHQAHVLLAEIMKNILVQTRILNVIGRDFLLSLNLN